MNRLRVQMIALLAIGGLIGYAIASHQTEFASKSIATETKPVPVAEKTKAVAAVPAAAVPAAAVPVAAVPAADGASPTVCLTEPTGKGQLLAMADPRVAQASARIAATGKKPNILVIMGDDVGWFNIGAYHRGIMSGKTPNLDKLAAEGMMFTDYYAEASCTAGRANFITGEIPLRTGLTTVGQAGRRRRTACSSLHARHRAQGPGLRHRPIRQEPSRRLEQVSAHRAWLRRVLRLSVSPRRHVGPLLVRLSAGLDRQDRPARSGALLGDERGRSDRSAAVGQGRQTEDRG